MDPKANLLEQVAIALDIERSWDHCNEDGTLDPQECAYVAERAGRLSELVLALDEWQRKGGFSPYSTKGGK